MARREGKALVWQRTNERLGSAIREAYEISPLPNPPLELPDFPAIPPSDSETLVRQALGIFTVDRQGFEIRLAEIIEIRLPDYVKRAIDPAEAESRWLEKNADEISERVLVLIARDWLTSALDDFSPDTDRWYLGASLVTGIALFGSEIARNECYPLIESIAYAVTPSSLPYSSVSGRHQLAWSPSNTPAPSLPPHPAGVMAVTAILDTLSLRDSSAHNVLPIWIENLSVSPSLSQVLDIPNRILQELNNTNSESVPIYVSAALQLLPNISAEAKDILVACSEHNNPQARRKVAESLSRIASEYPVFALSLADRLLEDTDSSVIALTATYIGGLSRSSGEDFIPRASMILESENQKAIQRVVESGLRDYLSQNPDDPHSLLVKAWINSSEIGRSRVANLIVEQYRVNPDYFMETCSNLAIVNSKANSELLQWIETRNPELSKFLS